MKKSLQILATAALLAAGSMTASAERYYETVGDGVTADNIQPGVQYAFQGGQSVLEGKYAFLSGSYFNFSVNLVPTCLYTFEATGETVEGSKVYYIKDKDGNYVYAPGNDNFYGTSVSRAWKVCVKDAAVYDSEYTYSVTGDDGEPVDYTGMDAYVAEAKESGSPFDLSVATYCAAEGGVVIVSANPDDAANEYSTYTYMLGLASGATSGEVSRGTNYNTNVWVVYETRQQDALSYLDAVITELFPEGFDPDTYETGINPGEYSEEALAALSEAYDAANGDVTEANAEALADALKEAWEKFQASFVSFKAGYYIFTSYRDPEGGALYENFDNIDGDDGWYADRTKNGLKWCWSSSNEGDANHTFRYDGTLEGDDWYKQAGLKYMVWQVIDSPVKNRYYFKNYVTGRYIHVIKTNNTQVPSVSEEELDKELDLYTMEPNPNAPGFWTFFNDNNWVNPETSEVSGIHAAGDYANTVAWGKSTEGSSWTIRTVTEEDLVKIEELSKQPELNAALEKLVAEAEKVKNDNINEEMALDGTHVDYATSEAMQQWLDISKVDGLVTSKDQIASNASDSEEGKDLGVLVDGDVTNLWHSSWHTGDSPKETDPESGEEIWSLHNLQLDLLKNVDAVTVKMASRNNQYQGMPKSIKVYGSNDGENWTLINDSVEISWYLGAYNKGNNDGEAGSKSYNGWFTTKLGYSHIRFDVFHTQSDLGDAGMYFNLSEVRAYEGAQPWAIIGDPESPYYVADKALRDEVDKLVETAEEELKDELATEETIAALRAAIDALKAGIPNPEAFKNLIEAAQRAHDSAVAGSTPGYFPQTAIDALQTAIDAANAAYKPGMNIDEIKAGVAALQAAIDAFQDALIKPADGYYMIRSKSSEKVCEGQVIIAKNSSAKVRIDKGGRVKNGEAYEDEPNLAQRPGAYWYVQKVDGGYTYKNLYTGLYLAPAQKDENGKKVDAIAQSVEPYVFGIRFANTEGCFNLLVAEEDAYNDNYFYVNAQPNGGVVTWSSAEGRDNSAWEFVAQDINEAWTALYDNGMLVDLEHSTAPQVVTFTVDVDADPSICTDVRFYSVIGQDDANNVQLKKEEGILKAGQAYIMEPIADEPTTSAYIYTAAQNFEEFVPTHTVGEVANGLVPVFERTSVAKGAGLFNAAHSQILLSEGSATDVVAANTGYFVEVPATAESGDAYIPAEGDILSIGQVIISNNADNKIYTVSGIRVNGSKQLPAGLYIMNGKKVIVK